MSVQPSGIAYLCTYSGILKTIEEVINVAIITFLAICGYTYQGYFLNTVVILALLSTLIFTILHVSGFTRRTKLPWHWIECLYILIMGFLVAIAATVALYVFTRGYIILGITGYILAAVYFLDTLDKYQIAVTPRPKYAWTTPHMPDLN